MCSRENWEKGFKSCLRGCLKYNFDTKLIKEGIKILISSLTYRDETSMLVYADCSVIIVSDLAVQRKMGILKSVVLIRRIELKKFHVNNSSL